MMIDIDTALHVTHPSLWMMWLAIGYTAGDFLGKLLIIGHTLITRRKP